MSEQIVAKNKEVSITYRILDEKGELVGGRKGQKKFRNLQFFSASFAAN